MAKLYVFGIGGTGARVMRSLTFLLASGVKIGSDIDTVVPIIIDPDNGNGDLTRTKQLLELYMKLNQKAGTKTGFFSTAIKTLPELTTTSGLIGDRFKMLDVNATQNSKFRNFIGYTSLSSSSKSLMDLLYSQDNLNADMTVGFKGNPNIGSIVLNQFKNSKEYQIFLNSFAPGDSIFIISSIFGGTGAAGFPLLLRNLRKVDANFPGSQIVANSRIGALSMMPYFKVNDPEDKKLKTIDSSSFMGKAKAALSFYSNSIFGQNNQLNSFYTLGEDASNFYDHNDGQAGQKNNAHFLELAAAVAVVDFSNNLSNMVSQNQMASQTIFKEFGVKKPSSRQLYFKSLGEDTRELLFKPLAKFQLMVSFQRFVKEQKKDFEKSPWHIQLEKVYSNEGIHDKYLKNFEDQFFQWLDEMEDNDIKFTPFKLNLSYQNLLNFIEGYEISGDKWKFWDNAADGNKFNNTVNSVFKSSTKTDNQGSDFIQLFDEATEIQINSILN